MSTIEIIGGSAAAVIGLGAYCKWAVRPVVIAYWVGRRAGQLPRRASR